MITEINIENIKCFESKKVTGLKQFNLITGDSNTGKTALLDAIAIMLNPYQYQKDMDEYATIAKDFVCISDDEERKVIIRKSRDFYYDNIEGKSNNWKIENGSKDPFIYSNAYNYKDNLSSRLESLIIRKGKQPTIDILKIIDSDISNFLLGYDNEMFIDNEKPVLIPIKCFAEGIQKILCLSTLQENITNGFVLIDNIEAGLPNNQKLLEALMRKIYKDAFDKNNQVFISTKSDKIKEALNRETQEINMIDLF